MSGEGARPPIVPGSAGRGGPGSPHGRGPSAPQCCGSDPRPGLRGARLPRYSCPFLVRSAGHRRLSYAPGPYPGPPAHIWAVWKLCVPSPVHPNSHLERKGVWKVCPPLLLDRKGVWKVCTPLPSPAQVTSGEQSSVEGVFPSLLHPRSHLREGRSGRCVPPSPVHQSPWQGMELDDSSPFHPKPFHGENPALLHDPCRFLGAGFCPGGVRANSWSPISLASSSLGMTRSCP